MRGKLLLKWKWKLLLTSLPVQYIRVVYLRVLSTSPQCVLLCALGSGYCTQSTVLFPRVPVSVFFVSLCELSCAIARARAPLLLGDMAGAGKTPEEEAYERKQEYKAYLHKHGMNTYGFCLEWWWWCL